jgi:hypothetical protein
VISNDHCGRFPIDPFKMVVVALIPALHPNRLKGTVQLDEKGSIFSPDWPIPTSIESTTS